MEISQKIERLEEQRKKLDEQKQFLIEKRKLQIGEFALRQGLLGTSDDLLIGALAYLDNIIKNNNAEKLNEVKKLSAPFCRKHLSQ